MADAELLVGHVLDVLGAMPEASVSCVVTSPPYWSLRKYDAPDVVWGGDPECPHTLEAAEPPKRDRQHLRELGERDGRGGGNKHSSNEQYGGGVPGGYTGAKRWQHSGVSRQETPEAWVKETSQAAETSKVHWQHAENGPGLASGVSQTRHRGSQASIEDERTFASSRAATCSRCGAWRGQYGLEPTPELYVEHTVAVLRAIRRVLREDGVVWWNIGDGYAASLGQRKPTDAHGPKQATNQGANAVGSRSVAGLKPKDLVLMPFRVALALQADGWWVRSVVIWSKPNAMPESTRDRPTTAHEYVLMLTKSARYWYDQDAVREPHRTEGRWGDREPNFAPHQWLPEDQSYNHNRAGGDGVGYSPGGRNLRSVWTFPTAQTPEAHFATFPEALPARCILASCPREICAKCGTARVRIVETLRVPDTKTGRFAMEGNRHIPGRDDEPLSDNQGGERDWQKIASSETLGWSSCACPEPDYQPGLVLDPFAGIGTTLVVAKQLGRRAVGIELSEEYAQIARKKLATWWRRSRQVEAETPEGQAVLL